MLPSLNASITHEERFPLWGDPSLVRFPCLNLEKKVTGKVWVLACVCLGQASQNWVLGLRLLDGGKGI